MKRKLTAASAVLLVILLMVSVLPLSAAATELAPPTDQGDTVPDPNGTGDSAAGGGEGDASTSTGGVLSGASTDGLDPEDEEEEPTVPGDDAPAAPKGTLVLTVGDAEISLPGFAPQLNAAGDDYEWTLPTAGEVAAAWPGLFDRFTFQGWTLRNLKDDAALDEDGVPAEDRPPFNPEPGGGARFALSVGRINRLTTGDIDIAANVGGVYLDAVLQAKVPVRFYLAKGDAEAWKTVYVPVGQSLSGADEDGQPYIVAAPSPEEDPALRDEERKTVQGGAFAGWVAAGGDTALDPAYVVTGGDADAGLSFIATFGETTKVSGLSEEEMRQVLSGLTPNLVRSEKDVLVTGSGDRGSAYVPSGITMSKDLVLHNVVFTIRSNIIKGTGRLNLTNSGLSDHFSFEYVDPGVEGESLIRVTVYELNGAKLSGLVSGILDFGYYFENVITASGSVASVTLESIECEGTTVTSDVWDEAGGDTNRTFTVTAKASSNWLFENKSISTSPSSHTISPSEGDGMTMNTGEGFDFPPAGYNYEGNTDDTEAYQFYTREFDLPEAARPKVNFTVTADVTKNGYVPAETLDFAIEYNSNYANNELPDPLIRALQAAENKELFYTGNTQLPAAGVIPSATLTVQDILDRYFDAESFFLKDQNGTDLLDRATITLKYINNRSIIFQYHIEDMPADATSVTGGFTTKRISIGSVYDDWTVANSNSYFIWRLRAVFTSNAQRSYTTYPEYKADSDEPVAQRQSVLGGTYGETEVNTFRLSSSSSSEYFVRNKVTEQMDYPEKKVVPFRYPSGGSTPGTDAGDYGLAGDLSRDFMAVNDVAIDGTDRTIVMNRQWFTWENRSTMYLSNRVDTFTTSEFEMSGLYDGPTSLTVGLDSNGRAGSDNKPTSTSYELYNYQNEQTMRGAGWVGDELDLMAFRLPRVGNSNTTFDINVYFAGQSEPVKLEGGAIPAGESRLRYLEGEGVPAGEYIAVTDGAPPVTGISYTYRKVEPNTYNKSQVANYTTALSVSRHMQLMFQLDAGFLNADTVKAAIAEQKQQGTQADPTYIDLLNFSAAGVRYGVTDRAISRVRNAPYRVRLVNEYMEGNKTVRNQTWAGTAAADLIMPGDELRYSINLSLDGAMVSAGKKKYLDVLDVPNSSIVLNADKMNVEITVTHAAATTLEEAKAMGRLNVPSGNSGNTTQKSSGVFQTVYKLTAQEAQRALDAVPPGPHTGALQSLPARHLYFQFTEVYVGDTFTINYTAHVDESAGEGVPIANDLYTRAYDESGTPPPWVKHKGHSGSVTGAIAHGDVRVRAYGMDVLDENGQVVPKLNNYFYHTQKAILRVDGGASGSTQDLYNPAYLVQLHDTSSSNSRFLPDFDAEKLIYNVQKYTVGATGREPVAGTSEPIEENQYTLTYFDSNGNKIDTLTEDNFTNAYYALVEFTGVELDCTKNETISFDLAVMSYYNKTVTSGSNAATPYVYMTARNIQNKLLSVYLGKVSSSYTAYVNSNSGTVSKLLGITSQTVPASFMYLRSFTYTYHHHTTNISSVSLSSEIVDTSRTYVVPDGKVDYTVRLSNQSLSNINAEPGSTGADVTHAPPPVDLYYLQVMLPAGFEALQEDLTRLVIKNWEKQEDGTYQQVELSYGDDYSISTGWYKESSASTSPNKQFLTVKFAPGQSVPYGTNLFMTFPGTYVNANALLGDTSRGDAYAYAAHYRDERVTYTLSGNATVSATSPWAKNTDFEADFGMDSTANFYRYYNFQYVPAGRIGPQPGLQKGIVLDNGKTFEQDTASVSNAATGHWITWQLRVFNGINAEVALDEYEVVDVLPTGILYRDPELAENKTEDSLAVVRDPSVYLKPTVTYNDAGEQVLIWRFGKDADYQNVVQKNGSFDIRYDVTLSSDDSGYRTNTAFLIPDKTVHRITIGNRMPGSSSADYGSFVTEDRVQEYLRRADHGYVSATGNAIMAQHQIELQNSVGAVAVKTLSTTSPEGNQVSTSTMTPAIVAETKRGARVDYTYSLENTSNYSAVYQGANIFDVLPGMGDKFAYADRVRGSGWSLELLGTETSNGLAGAFLVTKTVAGRSTTQKLGEDYELYFATTAPNGRQQLENLGAGTLWSPAADWNGEEIAAFYVQYKGDIEKDTVISVKWSMQVPEELDPTLVDKAAYNSGCFTFTYKINDISSYFAAETDKVGVTVKRSKGLELSLEKVLDDPTMGPETGPNGQQTWPEKTFYLRLLRDNGTDYVPHMFRSGTESFNNGLMNLQERGVTYTDPVTGFVVNDTTGVVAVRARADGSPHGGVIQNLPDGAYKVVELNGDGYYVTGNVDAVKLGFGSGGSGKPEVTEAAITVNNELSLALFASKTLQDDRLADGEEKTFFFRLESKTFMGGLFYEKYEFTGRETFDGLVNIQQENGGYTDPDTDFSIGNTTGVFALTAKNGEDVTGRIGNLPAGTYRIVELNDGDYAVTGDNKTALTLDADTLTASAGIINTYVTKTPPPASSSESGGGSSSTATSSSSGSSSSSSTGGGSSSTATSSSSGPSSSSSTGGSSSSSASSAPITDPDPGPGPNPPAPSSSSTVAPPPASRDGGVGGGVGGGITPPPAPSTATPSVADPVAPDPRLQQQSGNPVTDVMDGNMPLGGLEQNGAWSLLSLLMSVLGLVVAVFTVVSLFVRRRKRQDDDAAAPNVQHAADTADQDGEEENVQKRRSTLFKVLTILTGLLPGLLFLILDNMRRPMVFINNWTLYVGIAFLIHAALLVVTLIVRRRQNDEDIRPDGTGPQNA